jgi:DNA-directed RNA polymerase subunit H (RpoH/RPB5)
LARDPVARYLGLTRGQVRFVCFHRMRMNESPLALLPALVSARVYNRVNGCVFLQVVRIERKSATAKQYITYRFVA